MSNIHYRPRFGGGLMTSDQYRRVLVVDDDHGVREMLSAALRPKALVIDEAADGRQAIALLQENAYSVILLDIMMPGVDGIGVLDALDKSANANGSPVVLVVSGADRSVIESLDASRIHGVIRKPFDPHEIAAVVAACADIRGRSAFETMALATMISSAPLIAFLKL